MKISACEIFEIISDYCGNDITAVVQITNCLIETLQSDTKVFIYQLMEEVEEFSTDNNLCSRCGEELIINNVKECRGEFWGIHSEEDIYEKICPNGCEQE